MKQALFVCTGNTCRSPMAEGICRALAEEKGWSIQAVSCGLAAFPGDPAAPYAVEAARKYGADLTMHRSRPLSPTMASRMVSHISVRMMPGQTQLTFTL